MFSLEVTNIFVNKGIWGTLYLSLSFKENWFLSDNLIVCCVHNKIKSSLISLDA